MTQTELFEKALAILGTEYELNVCMEECAELVQAISKCRRYDCKEEWRKNLTEEIADVSLSIEMLKMIYNIDSSEIKEMTDYKLNRLINRLAQLETN